jgi:hypothetical protein
MTVPDEMDIDSLDNMKTLIDTPEHIAGLGDPYLARWIGLEQRFRARQKSV